MNNINVVTTSGESKDSISLKKVKKVSSAMISATVLANLSNKRTAIAHTKTKGEVRGGGKKPYRQKGTGRARAGSNRSPLWIGGGTTFGPRSNRNFYKRVNKKQKTAVLLHLINQKAESGNLKIVDEIKLVQPKTKEMIRFLSALGINDSALLVIDDAFSNSPESTFVYVAGRNISFLHITSLQKASSFMIMKHKWLIMTKKAVEDLNNKVIEKVEIEVKKPVKKTAKKEEVKAE
ncbi:MAG TPA: 50S ribosomal protein L4 [Patescibacteria group bacterium]|nr:50S ribosomal protein L4 [Patescibacteria group bacterium]